MFWVLKFFFSFFFCLVNDHRHTALIPLSSLSHFPSSIAFVFFKRLSILPLAWHHTLISFLIYRLIIRMSLQCPHWAAGGVIEQHKRHLKEEWIIELETEWAGGEWWLGARPAFSGGWPISGGILPGPMVNHVYVTGSFIFFIFFLSPAH